MSALGLVVIASGGLGITFASLWSSGLVQMVVFCLEIFSLLKEVLVLFYLVLLVRCLGCWYFRVCLIGVDLFYLSSYIVQSEYFLLIRHPHPLDTRPAGAILVSFRSLHAPWHL